MITQKHLKEILRYDPETGEFWWLVPFHRRRLDIPAGGPSRSDGRIKIGIGRRKYYAHRLAWLYVYGEWPPRDIDHINGDASDNRLSNLRLATHQQNMANRGHRVDNSSGFRGVYRKGEKWQAQIKVSKRTVHLGSFQSPEEAHAAYLAAARAHFGEFAREG